MKRTFECGHRGLGKYCHRCANAARAVDLAAAAAKARQEQKDAAIQQARLANAASLAPIDLSPAAHLPIVLKRVLQVLGQLDSGMHPLALGGKVLHSRAGDFSIPVGMRYRLLIDAASMKPLLFVSHEDYNALI
ncbi:DUF7682 family zinc-binding protein [Ralstonia pseudosolanacearum]|uniref:DUF7682 family zinc-binding protein n=1 Tax=Ralstonia pseudosolanacearum TaxID=1310165 RepID=UPI003CF686B0